MFWPDSKYGSGASQVLLSTREWRVEGGIRYHYNILNKRNMPSVLFNAQYGAHFFAVAKEEKQFDYLDENFNPKKANGINDHGLPDILYQYVTLGLGGRVPYFVTEKLYFAGLVNVNVHVPISFGEITNRFDSANTDTSTGPVPDIYGNGGFPGTIYSFNPDLSLRWSLPVVNLNQGGPVLTGDGTLLVAGTSTNFTAYYTEPACEAADLDCDGSVGPKDLSILLGAWGTSICPYDIDGSGSVDGADLGILLGAWGTHEADLNGDETTDGADLGILLGAWM